MELDPERDRAVLGRQRDAAGPDRCRIALCCGGLLALLALTGCGPGILPSQGVVGEGNTTIMIDSLTPRRIG